jgi:hypothetical protein
LHHCIIACWPAAQALLLGFLVVLLLIRPFSDDHRWKMPVRIALVFVAFMKVPPSLSCTQARAHARARTFAHLTTHLHARML